MLRLFLLYYGSSNVHRKLLPVKLISLKVFIFINQCFIKIDKLNKKGLIYLLFIVGYVHERYNYINLQKKHCQQHY